MCMCWSLLGWKHRGPSAQRGSSSICTAFFSAAVIGNASCFGLPALRGPSPQMRESAKLCLGFLSLCDAQKLCKGSKSRQLYGLPHLFPISQRSLTFIVWCLVFEEPLFHKSCMGLFWLFSRWNVNPVPVNSILDRSKSPMVCPVCLFIHHLFIMRHQQHDKLWKQPLLLSDGSSRV